MSYESKDLGVELEALLKINHGWKKDYEELRMRYEMLNGENKRIEDEKNTLKVRIKELEKQQTLLEKEISRFALSAQQSSNGGREHREILKSLLTAYEKVFERERADREKLHEDKENFKRQLEDAEDIIKQLTAELDALDAAAGGIAELIVDAL